MQETWLRLCRNTRDDDDDDEDDMFIFIVPLTGHMTPARTPRLHSNVVMHCIVMWGLSSAMISSLRNGIHNPEMEMNPLKMACHCPRGGAIKNGHTHSPSLHPMNRVRQRTATYTG